MHSSEAYIITYYWFRVRLEPRKHLLRITVKSERYRAKRAKAKRRLPITSSSSTFPLSLNDGDLLLLREYPRLHPCPSHGPPLPMGRSSP